jgi:hypothetical protein
VKETGPFVRGAGFRTEERLLLERLLRDFQNNFFARMVRMRNTGRPRRDSSLFRPCRRFDLFIFPLIIEEMAVCGSLFSGKRKMAGT